MAGNPPDAGAWLATTCLCWGVSNLAVPCVATCVGAGAAAGCALMGAIGGALVATRGCGLPNIDENGLFDLGIEVKVVCFGTIFELTIGAIVGTWGIGLTGARKDVSRGAIFGTEPALTLPAGLEAFGA